MELIKLVDGVPRPFTEAAFRAENKHTVYGKIIPDIHLNAQGVYRVRTLPMPSEIGKKAVVDPVPKNVNGEWVLGWTLKHLDPQEARSLRTDMLAASDWVVAKAYEEGRPVPEAWASYRQALRDITEQAGFPYEVIWPTKPE